MLVTVADLLPDPDRFSRIVSYCGTEDDGKDEKKRGQ